MNKEFSFSGFSFLKFSFSGFSFLRPRSLSGGRGRGRNRYTARRQRLFDLCAVFLFLLLLPYACSLIFGRGSGIRETVRLSGEQEGLWVICEDGTGEKKVPMEEYVQGALAASIPAECETETLKAQAVILRTLCVRACENRESSKDAFIYASDVGQKYLDRGARERLWGASFEEKEERLSAAVSDTAGLFLTWQGRTMEPAYFWLSAGKTRDGKEVLGEGGEYLVSVACPQDQQAEGFRTCRTLEQDRFWDRLGLKDTKKITLVRDSADYVLRVEAEGLSMSGEKFRALFDLPSACFSISGNGEEVTIESRGVGHGLGFCQYDANRRAAQGENYEALLKTFFKETEIRKTE